MPLIIIGCLLLLLVPAGLAVNRSSRRDLRAVRGAETLTTLEMQQRRGNGAFHAAFTGRAEPNATVTSYLGAAPCAWYRYQVIEHYEVLQASANGRKWYPKEQVVAQRSEPQWISLRDEHGALHCDLRETDADQPAGLDEVFRHRAEHPNAFGIQVPAPAHNGRTTGYELREWVIRPGQQLHVVGEVNASTGGLTIGRPRDGGRFLVSAQSGDQVAEQTRRKSNASLGCLLVVGGLGIVLIALGLFLN